MKLRSDLVKIWAYISMSIVCLIILFLFIYIFGEGAANISIDFLTKPPSGAVLGSEGGILPAITGSIAFTLVAIICAGMPATATALYVVFFCKNSKLNELIHTVMRCISGIPSIVLGLFSYSFFVKELQFGRCVLSAGIALGIMILPFIEVRIERAFLELPKEMVNASYALGCSDFYVAKTIILPQCRAEIISGLILGGCFAMGATAPLIFTGAVAYATSPHSLFAPAMALPLHLYLLVAQGPASLGNAYGTAFVMMAIILISNFLAIIYGRRRHKRWKKI